MNERVITMAVPSTLYFSLKKKTPAKGSERGDEVRKLCTLLLLSSPFGPKYLPVVQKPAVYSKQSSGKLHFERKWVEEVELQPVY